MDADFDHRALVAGISAEERRNFLEQSDRPGMNRAALHFGAIVFLGTWVAMGWSGWWLALLPLGILLMFLFTAMHECTHKTAFRTDWMNVAVCRVAGVVILLPPQWFRHFHLAHHRFTHDPQRDPELATAKPQTRAQYLLHVSGGPVWLDLVRTLVRNALGANTDEFVPERSRHRVRTEARVMLTVYGGLAVFSVWFETTILLWVWLLPLLLGQPFLRMFLLAEHTGCSHVANMLDNTRTTFTTRLVRLISWNMPYHTEHHVYPAVPFHKLPDFHRRMQACLVNTEPGYVAFQRKYASGLGTD